METVGDEVLLRDLPRLYILQDPLARGPAAVASSLAGLFNKTNSTEDKHAPFIRTLRRYQVPLTERAILSSSSNTYPFI